MNQRLSTVLLMGTLLAAFVMAPAQARQDDGDRINPLTPGVGDAVLLTDDDGREVASLTVITVEDDWADFPSNHSPRNGTRYVGFTIEAEALADSVELDADQFDLQIDPGLLIDASSVRGANEDIPVLQNDIDLARGDSATFVLVYSVPEDIPYSHLFWQDDDVLITIVSAASDARQRGQFRVSAGWEPSERR